MSDPATPKEANLMTFMVTQDFLPEHWNWTDAEKQVLSSNDCTLVGKVIMDRFKQHGIELEAAYIIIHDKDEHEIWNEYQNQYICIYTSNHIHLVGKLKKEDALTIEKISEIVGLDVNYLDKSNPGRYSFDNMLAYLIHIKYPEKYRYEAKSVITLTGPNYMKTYSERHKSWMRGRAMKIIANLEPSLKELTVLIAEGTITEEDLYTDPKYTVLLVKHMKQIDDLLENRKELVRRQDPRWLIEQKQKAEREKDYREKSYYSNHIVAPSEK